MPLIDIPRYITNKLKHKQLPYENTVTWIQLISTLPYSYVEAPTHTGYMASLSFSVKAASGRYSLIDTLCFLPALRTPLLLADRDSKKKGLGSHRRLARVTTP